MRRGYPLSSRLEGKGSGDGRKLPQWDPAQIRIRFEYRVSVSLGFTIRSRHSFGENTFPVIRSLSKKTAASWHMRRMRRCCSLRRS